MTRPTGDHVPHLFWIPAAAAAGFLAAFVFGDVMTLPVDVYYLLYFFVVFGFAALYVRATRLNVGEWLRRRLMRAIALGLTGGLVLMVGVLAQPETARLPGSALWPAIVWRGIVYGAADGLLLLALPWRVTWRAAAHRRPRTRAANHGATPVVTSTSGQMRPRNTL